MRTCSSRSRPCPHATCRSIPPYWAYEWFERGLLVDILLTQVFNFAKYPLEALSGLVVTVVIWLMVRSALRAERERAALAESNAGRVS